MRVPSYFEHVAGESAAKPAPKPLDVVEWLESDFVQPGVIEVVEGVMAEVIINRWKAGK